MTLNKKLRKAAAVVLSAAIAALYGTAGYYSSRLPETVTTESSSLRFALYPELSAEPCSGDYTAVSLFGTIPVKHIRTDCQTPPVLAAGGCPFGIKLLMDGVMVTDLGEVDSAAGKLCPAKAAGIREGDVIRSANGIPLSSNADLQRVISESSGSPVELDLYRGSRHIELTMTPVWSESSAAWKGGMWVRDSIAGIGTMTFIDSSTGQFAGLGHPICDSDTGELIPVQSGEAVPVEITRVRPGTSGDPGELNGRFTGGQVYGILTQNDNCGVYGRLTNSAADSLGREEFPLGYCQDVHLGEAYILTTVSGSEPKQCSVRIEKVDYSGKEAAKNMVIRITDSDLIAATGGIVQGMSGSPIIQDGKLIGAVTHVFVSDPTRGYAVFAENMYNSMK